MTLQQSIDELLRRGCSIHIGPCPGFMGLVTPERGTAVVVDGPTGRYVKHFHAIGSGYAVSRDIQPALDRLLESGALPVVENGWEAQ